MVSRAVAWGFATHNLPNWTRCGYVLYNTHDTVDIVHWTRLTECNIPEHCSASKPNPRAETDNYSERNGGAGSSKLGARSIIWPSTQLSHYQLLSSSKLSAHALPNYHLTRLHNYHIILFDWQLSLFGSHITITFHLLWSYGMAMITRWGRNLWKDVGERQAYVLVVGWQIWGGGHSILNTQ